jgi:hypothetical protein
MLNTGKLSVRFEGAGTLCETKGRTFLKRWFRFVQPLPGNAGLCSAPSAASAPHPPHRKPLRFQDAATLLRVTLSKTERLILLNQYRILEKVDPGQANSWRNAAEIVDNGYTLEYDSLARGLDEEVP